MKGFKFQSILPAALLLLLPLFSCSSDDNVNAITGKVTDANGDPVVNSKVVVTYDLALTIGRGSITANQPQIAIQFGLEEEQHVTVTIKESETDTPVITLFDQHTASGMYATVWNRKDENGILQPSGIYLAEINYELKEDETFLLTLNITDYDTFSFGEVKELVQTDEDGNFSILRDQLLHHHSQADNLPYELKSTIILQVFDEVQGLSSEKEIGYDKSRSSPEFVTIQFPD